MSHRCTHILSATVCLNPRSIVIVSAYTRLSAIIRPLCFPLNPLTPFTCETHHPLHSLMSRPIPSTSSSPNFQLVFNNALDAYKKRTKNDLLAHPLVVQLQTCTSSGSVLALIHQQVQGVQRDDDRLTKWLDPTVRVLLAFSETLGEGVGLVSLRE